MVGWAYLSVALVLGLREGLQELVLGSTSLCLGRAGISGVDAVATKSSLPPSRPLPRPRFLPRPRRLSSLPTVPFQIFFHASLPWEHSEDEEGWGSTGGRGWLPTTDSCSRYTCSAAEERSEKRSMVLRVGGAPSAYQRGCCTPVLPGPDAGVPASLAASKF